MATKHLLALVKDGEFKAAAFGRWDGMPKTFGTAVMTGLTPELIESVRANLDLVDTSLIMDGVKAPIHENDMYPNSGFDFQACFILKTVNDLTQRTVVPGCLNIAVDSFCEWVYVIDFDKNTFEVHSQYAQNLDEPNRFDFLADHVKNPTKIGLIKSYDLSALPESMNIVNPYDPAA